MKDPIDIKDLSVGDVLSSMKRLKLGSLLWLLGSATALLVAAYGAGSASKIDWEVRTLEAEKLKNPVFVQHFTENFVDRENLTLLIPEILEESPDGIETDAEAISSLLWQLKAQDGYAQFLTANEFFSVQVTHDGENFNFEWDRGASVIPKILNRLSLPSDEGTISQLNSEMNLIGVAWLPGSDQIVRDVDGGLALVRKQ